MTAAETQAPPEATVNVVVQKVEPTTLPDAILLPASVEPLKSVTVPVEVQGKVEWLGVREGAQVQEGQELAKVETKTLSAELDRAKANYALAQSDFDRSGKLYDQKLISDEQFERVKSELAVQKSLLEVAQVAFDKASVRAPVSGVFNKRYIEVGEYVKAGDPVGQIVQVDSVKVVIDVPEKDINSVALGTVLGILLDKNDTNPLSEKIEGNTLEEAVRQAVGAKKILLGNVTYRSVVADEKTRTYRVEVTAPNPELRLLPGMIVRAVLLRRMIENTIAVPLVAVVPRESRAVVYVEKEGRAVERTVSLGVTDGRNIQVLAGLAAGENLVVDGQRQLKDGTLLKIVRPNGKNHGNGVAANAAASTDSAASADSTATPTGDKAGGTGNE
jgi:membrane fusion protein (multidrug efflux system)